MIHRLLDELKNNPRAYPGEYARLVDTLEKVHADTAAAPDLAREIGAVLIENGIAADPTRAKTRQVRLLRRLRDSPGARVYDLRAAPLAVEEDRRSYKAPMGEERTPPSLTKRVRARAHTISRNVWRRTLARSAEHTFARWPQPAHIRVFVRAFW